MCAWLRDVLAKSPRSPKGGAGGKSKGVGGYTLNVKAYADVNTPVPYRPLPAQLVHLCAIHRSHDQLAAC